MTCISCLAQYEHTSPQKWLISFFGAFMASVAIYAGLLLQSWLMFIFLGLVVPVAIAHAIACFSKLKLVGIKGMLRARGL